MKKLLNTVVLTSMILFTNNILAASLDEIKIEIKTLTTLLENKTLTQEQFDLAAGNALEGLEEYNALKKLFDAEILDYSQFWDSINKILGMDESMISASTNSSSKMGEKELLSNAIGSVQSITADTATKDKLELYETAINNISQIELNYPGSDTAIKLKTNQDIGDFSISKIRKDYLDELLGYYDIVCEKSPSYLCLGFVSLKTGQDMCQIGSGFDDLDVAHESLINAVKIFKGQETNSAYSNIALASYRTCNKDVPGASAEWSKGYFAIPLVRTLLDLGDEKTARGIIENLDDPYFKFLSVLEFKIASDDAPNLDYRDRMRQYVDEKIDEYTIDFSLSKFSLAYVMLKNSEDAFDYNDARYAYYEGKMKPSVSETLECGGFIMSYFHKGYMDFLVSIYQMDKNRWGSSWGYQFPSIVKGIAPQSGVFKNCSGKDRYDSKFYYESVQLLGDLLIFNGLEDANKFRDFIINDSGGKKELLFDYYVDLRLSNSKSENVSIATIPNNGEFGLGELKRGLSSNVLYTDDQFGKGENLQRVNGDYGYEKFSKILYLERYANSKKLGPSAIYKVFQSYVDFENVCKSAEILFQQLKGTEYYQDAVDYMVSSPRLDPNKKYSCGDENLELLLN